MIKNAYNLANVITAMIIDLVMIIIGAAAFFIMMIVMIPFGCWVEWQDWRERKGHR
jgi:uncharacterized membrane protein